MAHTPKIVLSRDQLPEDEEDRYERLVEYFCDRTVSCSVEEDGWLLTLGWQSESARFKDPDILQGLRWWSPSLTLTDLPLAVRQESHFQLALNDCWCLFSWSRWLRRSADQGVFPTEVVLLHVDDHNDLMSPRVVRRENGWVDAISGDEFSLLEPASVASAIESGAVGVGSFVVPLLFHVPIVHIRHLCARGRYAERIGIYQLNEVSALDDLLAPGALRQAITLGPIKDPSQKGHTYRATPDPLEWVADLPEAPAFLHFDLDYFNNRFDGDSAWRNRTDRHDPPLDQILSEVKRVFESLRVAKLDGRIVDVTVAMSPRFFPVEFWHATLEAVRAHVKTLPGLENRAE